MSIQLAAKHLAAHGRGPDTTLVHMTPGEVASLQALAQQHGGSLSINPQTGLPEAGFLSALLPMAAGAGLAAMGMPAGYAALSVGAASAATNGGDLRKGLMNGISAYGGAGMAESFMGAGAAMQSGTATSWMGGEAPVTAAAPTIEVAPSAGNLAGASQQEAINQAGMYRGPSYAAEAGNVSLASAAPAEVAQAAAAATPAAQAAQQAASLDTMNMSQRFDALKAGASGTNAMNYIKANPFASLGTATAMLTPDENKTPQKAADTDRGPRAGLSYYPGWSSPMPKPNMQGVEQTYNRPYYAAKGGVTRMATGGITSAPRNQQQLFADYLQRVSSSGVAATPPTNKYDWWKSGGAGTPAAAPTETPEQYAARMSLNARGGGGGQSQEQKDQREADLDRVDDYLSTPENQVTMRQYWAMDKEARDKLNADAAERNPIRGTIYKGVTTLGYPMFLRGAEALQGIIKDFMGPSTKDPKSVGMVFPTEKDRIKAEETAKYRQALLGDTSPYADTSTTEIDRATTEDARNAAVQRAQAEAENDARIQGDLNPYTSAQFSAAALPSTPYASGRNSNYSEPTTGFTTPVVGTTTLSRPTLVASEKLAGDKPIGGIRFNPADARTPYGEGEGNRNKYEIAAYIEQQEGIAKNYMDSGVVFGFDHPKTVALKEEYNRYNNVINNLYNRVQYTDPTTDDYKTPFVNYTSAAEGTPYGTSPVPPGVSANQFAANYAAYNNSYAPSVPYQDTKFVEGKESPSSLMYGPNPNLVANADSYAQESGLSGVPPGISYNNFVRNYEAYNNPKTTLNVTPDIVGINEISADPNADKTAESLRIPDAATFAAMLGAPFAQTAALNNGVVSDAGGSGDPALAGYQGGYNPGYATPNMGYGQGRGAFGIGGVWTNREGVPITTRDGSPVMTGAGAEAMQRAVAESNAAANRTYGNSINSGPANDGRADPGGEGGTRYGSVAAGYTGGSEAADGGLSTPYGFQHMANGGLSAMANPYDLGSYSDGGRLLRGPGDGVSDSIPATIGKGRPARLADGEFVIPARIVSEIGNGSTDAGARKLYAMMDRIQAGRKKSVGKGKVAVNSRAYKHLPA